MPDVGRICSGQTGTNVAVAENGDRAEVLDRPRTAAISLLVIRSAFMQTYGALNNIDSLE